MAGVKADVCGRLQRVATSRWPTERR